MNNNQSTRINDIAGICVFGTLGMAAMIAGCCGYPHQFVIAGMAGIMVATLAIELKHIKNK